MTQDKESKKKRIEKLRLILDDISYKDLNPEDEKYLFALKQRLKEKDSKIKIKRVTQKDEELSMEPKIVVHEDKERVKVRIADKKEDITEQKKPEVVEKIEEKSERFTDDLFEIQRSKSKGPEFIKVKPKEQEKKLIKTDDEKKELETLTEWEQVKSSNEEKPEINKEQKKETEDEWISVKNNEKKPIEKKEEIETDNLKEKKNCIFCEELIENNSKYCPKCGNSQEKDIQKPEKNNSQEEDIIENTTTEIQEVKKEMDIIEISNSTDEKENKNSREPSEEKQIEEEKVTIEEEKPQNWEYEEDGQDINLEENQKKIDVFNEIENIDDKTAILLYDNGYTTKESIEIATIKELNTIKGIKKRKIKKIKKELEEKTQVNEFEITEEQPYKDSWEKPDEVKPIPISDTAKGEIVEEELIEESISVEDKIKPFEDMKSIDEDTAIILFNSGYTSFDYLKQASYDDLKKIKGIKRKIAKNIIDEIGEKIQESVKVKPINVGDTAEGEIKEDQIIEEAEKYEEKTGKPSPVELGQKKSEWKPVEDENKEFEIQEETYEDEKFQTIPDLEYKEKIEPFNDIKNIDDQTAILLYDNGYTTKESIEIATIKELNTIKGIKKRKIKKIKNELDEKDQIGQETDEESFIESEKKDIIEEKIIEKEKNDRQEKIKIFKDYKTIDDKTAILLFDNGYTNIDSLKTIQADDLKNIKGIKKRDVKKIINEINENNKDNEKDEDFIEKEEIHLDEKIKTYEEPEKKDEEFFEEETDEDLKNLEIKDEENLHEFDKISAIDEKIKELLLKNKIETIVDLNNKTIKELTKIKGIRKKIAQKIKKDVKDYIEENNIDLEEELIKDGENPFIKEEESEEEEWETIEDVKTSPKKTNIKEYRHGDYTLFEKEIKNNSGSKRIVRFFSKGQPEGAKPINLPKDFEIKENKKTGVPYLKKKKK